MKRDELNAASRSRVCNVDLAQFSRSCSAARIAAPVFDVFNECSQSIPSTGPCAVTNRAAFPFLLVSSGARAWA